MLDDDGADEEVSDDEDARKRKAHLCGPNCRCEFLTRPKLREQAPDLNTHLLMCYQGTVIVTMPQQSCYNALFQNAA